jgi:hypothetical protein
MACQTVSTVAAPPTPVAAHASPSVMSSGDRVGVMQPVRADAMRNANNMFASGGSKTVIIIAVVAAVVVAALLLSGGGGNGY